MKKIVITILCLVLCFGATSCGGSGSGLKAGEQFTIGEYTLTLEQVNRTPEKDSNEEDAYEITLLLVGTQFPIKIINNEFVPGIKVILNGKEEIETNFASALQIDDVEGYGSRATFSFYLPKGSSVPKNATVTGAFNNGTGDEDAGVELNLAEVLP